jgi:molybdenum cofactor cytidylyltransferase
MALSLGERTVIERSIEGMYDVVERILVVVGWREDTVRGLLAPYPKVEFVPNEAYRQGMFSSVRAGVARVRAAWCFLQPGDIPLVGAEVYEQLLQEADAAAVDVAIPTYGGRRGHPLLMARRVIPRLLDLPPEATLRDLIRERGYLPVPVSDENILHDIDTIDDYRAMATRYERRIDERRIDERRIDERRIDERRTDEHQGDREPKEIM